MCPLTMINVYMTSLTQFDFCNIPDYSLEVVSRVISGLEYDIIDGLTGGMSIGNMVKFREYIACHAERGG